MRASIKQMQLAAKAAGGLTDAKTTEIEWHQEIGEAWVYGNGDGWAWRPLKDGDHAIGLAVSVGMRIDIDRERGEVEVYAPGVPGCTRMALGRDMAASVRKAIFLTAIAYAETLP